MINQSIYLVSYVDMIIYLLLVFTNEKKELKFIHIQI